VVLLQTHIITVPAIESTKTVKRWAKVVERVDMTKTDGYAFGGKFSAPEETVVVTTGAAILIVDTRKHVWNKQRNEWIYRSFAKLYQVNETGELEEVASADGRSWALKLRDKVAELLDQHQDAQRPFLMKLSDEVLLEEMNRRGYTVVQGTTA
jgi:hypothetical protein